MKKTFMLAAAAMFMSMQLNAQQKFTINPTYELISKTTENAGIPQMPKHFNGPKINQTVFTTANGSYTNPTQKEATEISDQIIQTQMWGHLTNVDNQELQLFQQETDYSETVTTNIKFLDENTLQPIKEFNIELPETTNMASVLGEYTSKVGENQNQIKIFIYVHFFEGGQGPEFMKDQIWVINETGEIISKIDAQSIQFINADNGDAQMLTFHSSEEAATIELLNNEFAVQNSKEVSFDLLNYYLGNPLQVMEINGEKKIVVSHYEKLFMNNETMEVTPDNHLVIELFDNHFNLEKTVNLDISSVYPDDPMAIPQAKFGVFHFNNQYDVSDHTFNADDNLEFLYQIEYYHMLTDQTWNFIYVGNESGERIKSFENPIFSSYELMPIQGESNQIGYLTGTVGDGETGPFDGGGAEAIQMFSIEDWAIQHSFPAIYNDQQLMGYFNRIPSTNGYSYLIGINEGLIEDGNTYGIVNQYSKTGELEQVIKLNIGQDPQFFMPILDHAYLNPTLYNNDSDLEFTYIHKHTDAGSGVIFNEFSVTKNAQLPIFSVAGSNEYQDIIGSGFVFNKTGDTAIKLALIHDRDFMTNTSLTEFYNIPFEGLSTQDPQLQNVMVYTNSANKVVAWTKTAQEFAIYDLSGRLVSKGKNSGFTSTASFSKGIYFVKLVVDGQVINKKFMVK